MKTTNARNQLSGRPRVLLIGDTPPPYSGPEIGMRKLLRSRIQNRFSIHHFSFKMNTTNANRGRVTASKIFHFWLQLVRLSTFLRHNRPDCVYYYFAQTRLGLMKDLPVISVVRRHGAKLVLHLRGSNFRKFYEQQPAAVRRLIGIHLDKGDRILVQSKCLKEMFRGIVAGRKIGVLCNGLELDELSHPDKNYSADRHPIVFFLGQLSYTKGYFDLILALPKIASKVSGVKFVFAGERIPLAAERNIRLHYIKRKKSPAEIVRQAEKIEREYADHIEYLGVIDAAARKQAMARSDLFVLPTYSEGFSNAVLEAMGCGLPVITTPVGAHPDIFTETPEVLVPTGNTAVLASRIIDLLESKTLQRQYGAHNLNLVKMRYTMDTVAKQFEEAVEFSVNRH